MPVTTPTPTPPSPTPPAGGASSEGRREAKVPGWVKGVGIGGAVVMLALAAYMLLAGKVPQVCRDEVASSDTAKTPDDLVVRVCEPMEATDPRVFLFLLVVFLLLLPFFSEIEVAGLFRVKRQLEEAQEEVDGLRESVRAAQAQVATLAATVTATTTSQASNQTSVQVQVVDPRGLESAQSQQLANAGDDEVPFTEGAFAQTAFRAGLVGLQSLFPADRAPYAMLFFTWGDDELELSQTVGDVNDQLGDTATLVADPSEAFASITQHGLLLTAPALDDDGSAVGAVVAAFHDQTLLEDHEPLFADTENVASAYARLLVDLLGETGRLTPRIHTSSDAIEGGL